MQESQEFQQPRTSLQKTCKSLARRMGARLNVNMHMRANCYGTASKDMAQAIANKEITRIAILMLTALGNINLTDTVLWARKPLFEEASPIQYVVKKGETIKLTQENFKTICPKVDVDFKMVNSIIKRHQID